MGEFLSKFGLFFFSVCVTFFFAVELARVNQKPQLKTLTIYPQHHVELGQNKGDTLASRSLRKSSLFKTFVVSLDSLCVNCAPFFRIGWLELSHSR